jgi:hypothetical protein
MCTEACAALEVLKQTCLTFGKELEIETQLCKLQSGIICKYAACFTYVCYCSSY